MPNKYEVRLVSERQHNSQIMAGFYQLGQDGYDVKIRDMRGNAAECPYIKTAYVKVIVNGEKTLVYDTLDGYQFPEAMKYYLDKCDFYFKRSFSAEENPRIFGTDAEKIYPLGFNYLVSFRGNPLEEGTAKKLLKMAAGRKTMSYFTSEKFECEPVYTNAPKIIFCTRLWEGKEINSMRIELIRRLRDKYGDRFFGGLTDNEIARQLAPDLILPKKYTVREAYLKKMQESDICIATTGLFDSIGWKTAEYVAAAKGIVSEKLSYQVTGDFKKDVNYLEFETVEQCLDAVDKLADDPDRLYTMRQANAEYYKNFLQPKQLILNSLKTAGIE